MLFKKDSLKSGENRNFLLKLIILTIFVSALFLVYQIGNILVILIFALFLNILFSSFLNKFNRWMIRDWLGIIIIYFIMILFIATVFFAIVPIFIKQTILLINHISDGIISVKNIFESKGIDGFGIPDFIKGFLINIDFKEILENLKNNMSEISTFIGKNFKNFLTNGAGFLFSITNAFVNLILVFVFSFFIALERKQIRSFLYKILPYNVSKHIHSHEKEIVDTLYNWLKGQMVLGASIFLITLFGLLALRLFGVHIEEYFILALIAGMMEFIPYIGPFIALMPALAISAALGYKASIIVLILYIVIQQVENNILVPFVMSKSLSLSPFSVLIAMMIGASLFGIIGIIVAIPVVSIIQIFLAPYLAKKKEIE